VFQRRQKRSKLQHLKEVFWPTIGWLRAATYWSRRIIRLRGTPHSIALGLAIGAGVAITPFVGLHFVMMLLLCWALGGQVLAGLVGTFVGNPWTFPFIWWATHRLGCIILQTHAGFDGNAHITFHGLLDSPLRTLAPMLGPMLVGSIPLALIVGWAIYIPARHLIAKRQQRRADKLRLRRDARENAPLVDRKIHG
jgi:uncharacterized protein (DUF2062 family)